MIIINSPSFIKTDFYKTYNTNIVDIENIEDLFIELYFNVQDNFKQFNKIYFHGNNDINSNEMNKFNEIDLKNKVYNLYEIFYDINEYFYSEPIFPFEVAIYLIYKGYKEHFLSDMYYLILLYETPEIYNRIIEDDYYRNNHNVTQSLIEYENDYLNISDNLLHKYKDYIVSKYMYKEGYKVYETYRPNIKNIINYTEIVNLLYSRFETVINIINIQNVAICGGFVNNIIFGNYNVNDIDIFLYGDLNDGDILNITTRIIKMITYGYGADRVIYDSKNCITILLYDVDEYTRKHTYQIIKRKYVNIQQILLGFDLDSSACALYSENNKIIVSYLPRYKFAVENKINIINPYRQSYTYNKRLLKYSKRGFCIFIPGAVHGVKNYINFIIKYPSHTLQHLIGMIIRNNDYGVVKEDFIKSDYMTDFKLIYRYILNSNTDYHYYETKIGHKILKVYDKDKININEFLTTYSKFKGDKFNMYDLSIDDDINNTFNFTNFKYLEKVLKYTKVNKNWLSQDPGTQITGTFNPTNYDYLNIYDLEKINYYDISDNEYNYSDDDEYNNSDDEYNNNVNISNIIGGAISISRIPLGNMLEDINNKNYLPIEEDI